MLMCKGNCIKCGRCFKKQADSGIKTIGSMFFLPDDFVPDISDNGYGLAFDIGTTTVACMLWDLSEGKAVSLVSASNPQIKHGSDVITRISFASDEEKLGILHDEIIECMNKIVLSLCRDHSITPEYIICVSACGNTTMSHLLLKKDPKPLSEAPFKPSYTGAVTCKARSLKLNVNENADLFLIPNIAGHVGGDITSGLLAVRLSEKEGNNLFVDIGTNGEIALFSSGKKYVCSTAAGPAFEGASIYQGMRAQKGAIDSFRIINGEMKYTVIDNTDPVGICGSGLIDIISELLKNRYIDKTGMIIKDGDSEKKIRIARSSDNKDIFITQQDIREVQLAKAAIAAGIKILLNKAQINEYELDSIYLAGAFGNTIDKQSAINIGLLPHINAKKIISAGNTAVAGALMTLSSKKERDMIIHLPDMIEHVELANEPDFQDILLESMSFD